MPNNWYNGDTGCIVTMHRLRKSYFEEIGGKETMEKLLKRVVSIVCAMAMVVSGLVFTPSSVDADTGHVPSAVETQVGAWGLYANNTDTWAGYSEMDYEYSGGTELNATKMILKTSPHGNYNQVSWFTYARLANCLSQRNLEADVSYKLKIKGTIKYPEGEEFENPNYENGRGIIIANIQGNTYNIPITQEAYNKGEFVMDGTFDYDVYAEPYGTDNKNPDDLYLYLAGLMTGTTIQIDSVTFDNMDGAWTPVPNWNVDDHPVGTDPVYQEYGMYKALAMRSNKPTTGLFGKMKVKNNRPAGSTADDALSDYSFRVTQSGWINMGETGDNRSSWATSLKLDNYCEGKVCAGKPLVTGEMYKPVLTISSSEKTEKDNKGRDKKIQVVVDGHSYETSLAKADEQVITFDDFGEFEYAGNPTISIDLDGVEDGTEITINDLYFTSSTAGVWNAVKNETTETVGKFDLFARTCTGIGDDNAQWGALSWKNADGVTTPTKMEDTLIKVRSASGWHDAWATLATVHHYIDQEGDPNNLKVGKQYKAKVTYYSSKATKFDKFGNPKTMLLSVDQNQLKFPLEACGDDTNNYKEVWTDPFVYEAEQTENDPSAIVFNMDQLEKGTILRIKDVEFVEDTTYDWTPIGNDEWTDVITSGTGADQTKLQLYARMGKTVQEGSWGKMSYKFDGEDHSQYSNVLVKNRSVSGWFVTNNPANAIDFVNAEKQFGLHKGWTYTLKLTVASSLTDDDAIKNETNNEMRVMANGELLPVKDFTPNPEDDNDHTIKTIRTYDNSGKDLAQATVETEEFVYAGTNKDLRIILDKMTKNSEFKVVNVEFIHKSDEPEYQQVDNDDPTQVGAWMLYCLTNPGTGAYGDMLYAEKTGDKSLGDVEIYCYGTSGWFAGDAGMLATLRNYTKDTKPLDNGKNYSCAITITSNKDIAGVTTDPNGSTEHYLKVTINNVDYGFEVYEGTYTYVIPKLKSPYSSGVNDNVVFNLDAADKGTKLTISDVDFTEPGLTVPKDITALDAVANSDGTITATWEQDKGTIYGDKETAGGFNVYVDDKKVNSSLIDGKTRTFTTGKLDAKDHTIKVVGVLGAVEGKGMEKTVKVSPVVTTTQAPTQKPTETPTGTPGPTETATGTPGTTAAPATTVAPSPTKAPVVTTTTKKGSTVKKPGKAKVKKVVKKKKSAKKIKVTLKKVKGATKYQVAVYKTKKNAKKNKKALVKKVIKKLKATIKSKKLKGKKTVYVKVRAWNTAGYGKWSGVKKSKKK